MAQTVLTELLKAGLALCNADEWQGEEPNPDFHAKFFARLIHNSINRFWEQDSFRIARLLKKKYVAEWIARLEKTEQTMLGFAMRKHKLDYLEALAGKNGEHDLHSDVSWEDEHGAPQAIWPNLIFDEQLASSTIARLKKSRAFQDFVEVDVAVVLQGKWKQAASCETIIWAQHMALVEYRRRWPPRAETSLARHIQVQLSLTDPSADMHSVLYAIGATEETYCLQRPGLRQHEYDAMKKGRLTLGEIYQLRPAVFLRALLPEKAPAN